MHKRICIHDGEICIEYYDTYSYKRIPVGLPTGIEQAGSRTHTDDNA